MSQHATPFQNETEQHFLPGKAESRLRGSGRWFFNTKLPFKFLVNQRFNLDVIDIILTVIIYRVKPRHRPLHQELEGQFWC